MLVLNRSLKQGRIGFRQRTPRSKLGHLGVEGDRVQVLWQGQSLTQHDLQMVPLASGVHVDLNTSVPPHNILFFSISPVGVFRVNEPISVQSVLQTLNVEKDDADRNPSWWSPFGPFSGDVDGGPGLASYSRTSHRVGGYREQRLCCRSALEPS